MITLELSFILFGLGAYHGLNPAMGWLFASARGLQTNSRTVICTSLVALTLGHLAAIGVVLFIVGILGYQLPLLFLKILVASLLTGLGLYHIFRNKHPGWFGMQIGTIGIFMWSFVMASAHGAGLMLLPFLMKSDKHMEHAHFEVSTVLPYSYTDFAAILSIHTLGYVIVATVLAFLIYEKLGVYVLKKAWINFDLIWAATLILTGLFVFISII